MNRMVIALALLVAAWIVLNVALLGAVAVAHYRGTRVPASSRLVQPAPIAVRRRAASVA